MDGRVATVAFQGLGASRSQIAKYAGPEGLELPGGAGKVIVAGAPLLLHSIHEHPELAEVGHGFSPNPVHWLMMLSTAVKNRWDGTRGAPPHWLRVRSMEMAGETNVSHFLAAVEECAKVNPDKRLVLFGTSRGAATVFVALTKMSRELRARVAFAVMEGIPDSVDGVLGARSYFPKLVGGLVRLMGVSVGSPLACAADYPSDVKSAFVTSKADTVVPSECSWRVIRALESRGLKPIHMSLINAGHSSYSIHNPSDQKIYRDFFDFLYATSV